ncbi:hypothetical protein C672_3605 [[Clostridium] bifermentans ATCC 638]|uniref:Uncharacterized protein n=1 Tax=Paraclostridium bifermentans ATCC 638 = DSM 14991 TaxID=1233171 RepID=T4VG81_PARBF|nr:hypothetical protein [Paraclostridium bifermentans]EQK39771.1 hypothetical protein C672_3605 [[Clostridium] bifermentans ATCC 638] [Paraclostridium bifermentans ATCC 638 = DSM 14991]RIZ57430.1 hypothetical protein CHH45_16465 [Paraclostridium bifermentans]
MYANIKPAMFGHMKIYDCNLCDSRKEEQTNTLQIEGVELFICDDCLQELNRKIVDHLAEKNL